MNAVFSYLQIEKLNDLRKLKIQKTKNSYFMKKAIFQISFYNFFSAYCGKCQNVICSRHLVNRPVLLDSAKILPVYCKLPTQDIVIYGVLGFNDSPKSYMSGFAKIRPKCTYSLFHA